MKPKAATILLHALALSGCAPPVPTTSSPALSAVAPPMIAELPVSITVKQRSTSPIPGSKERLSVTVDDITRDQVMVSVIGEGGRPLLGPISMKSADSATFRAGSADYSLKLTELNNALVGEDFASFVVADANAGSLTEAEKIERLIAAVESMTNAAFIRNGQEHSANDAADHLRLKLESAKDKNLTASQFIEHIASKSSLTGEEYQIRMPDGRTVPTGEYLRNELEMLELGRESE